jgi:hypothetical protein
MKHFNDTIGNRTRDLPACRTEPQPTAPPRAPITLRHTIFSRTLLDEGSPRHRELYLTISTTHKEQTSMHPTGFEPRNYSKRAAADSRFRPRGYWYWLYESLQHRKRKSFKLFHTRYQFQQLSGNQQYAVSTFMCHLKPHSVTFMCLPLGFIKCDDTHKTQPCK